MNILCEIQNFSAIKTIKPKNTSLTKQQRAIKPTKATKNKQANKQKQGSKMNMKNEKEYKHQLLLENNLFNFQPFITILCLFF